MCEIGTVRPYVLNQRPQCWSIHKVSLLRDATTCTERVMTTHEACTSGTSRVLTVSLFQRLKIEALILAPTDCEVHSVMKFLKNRLRGMLGAAVVLLNDNARPHTARRSRYLLQKFSWKVSNHPHAVRTSLPVIFISSFISWNLSDQSQRFHSDRETEMSVSQWFQSQAANFYEKGIQKFVQRYDMSQFRRWMLKNSSTLAVFIPISLSIKMEFISVIGPREIYFVDALRTTNRGDHTMSFRGIGV